MKCLWHIPQRYTMKAEKPLLGEMISVFSWEEYAFFNPLISWLYKRNKACKDSHVIRLPCLKGLLFFSAAELKHFRIQENVFLSLKKKEKKWRVSFSQSLPFTNPPLGHLSTISWKKKKKKKSVSVQVYSQPPGEAYCTTRGSCIPNWKKGRRSEQLESSSAILPGNRP